LPQVFTPGAWLESLDGRLTQDQRELGLYERYFDGHHRLRFATEKFRDVFGGLFGTFADNWCQIIVNASVERLQITGFRFGKDEQADSAAWDIWQRNNLDAASVLLHTEAIKVGRAYLLVDPNSGDPRITVEHPSQVIVAHAAGDRTQRLAGLKKWRGEDNYLYANVYLPEVVFKYRSKDPHNGDTTYTRANWIRRPDDPGGVNPLGVVPIIPVYNDPSMMGGGQSDLKVAIPLQDAVNKQVLDMMVTSEAAAFPLRIGAGIEQPRDPITGELIPNPELKLSQSKFMMVPEGGSLTQLPAADLNNYVKPIEMLIQHLAAQTRTPPHYLLSSIINASGDALKAAEAGLVSKVEKKILDFSDPWEEAMRLAFLAKDDPTRGREMAAHTMWRDPEKKSLSELADYGVKLRSIGVPYEFIWPTLGFTPEDIRRMKELTGLPDRPPPGAITGDTLEPGTPAPPTSTP
jgi:hypothetical protein